MFMTLLYFALLRRRNAGMDQLSGITDRSSKIKLALFWVSGHLEASPAVFNLAIALARSGFQVDLYTARNATCPEPRISEPGVTLLFLPGKERRLKEPVVRITARFVRWVLPKVRAGGYHYMIGAGIRGLFASAVISSLTGVPAAYQCVEMYPSWQHRTLPWRVYKSLERWANRRMRFTIIQDEMRAEMLARDNHITRKSIVLLPVAPLGPPILIPSTFLTHKFGLHQKTIILYAGALFAPFSASEDLVAAAQDWPEDWVLVLHSVYGQTDSQYTALKKLDIHNRTVLSTDSLPYEEITTLMASATVGLAIYKTDDDNLVNMGMSSGKLAEFLRCGVPAVVSDFPGMRDLVEQYGIGRAVRSASEVQAAIRAILADYENFRAKSARCFAERLALEIHIQNVVQAIQNNK